MTDTTPELLPIEPSLKPPNVEVHDEYFIGKPRPSHRDEIVQKRAAKRMLPDLLRWIEQDVNHDDMTVEEVEHVEEDLQKLVRLHPRDDGFNLAKELESAGYDGDSQLVEVLDRLSMRVRYTIESVTKQWVRANHPEATVRVGDTIRYRSSFAEREGTVTALKPDVAQAVVGDVGAEPNTGGYYVNYEDLILIPKEQNV